MRMKSVDGERLRDKIAAGGGLPEDVHMVIGPDYVEFKARPRGELPPRTDCEVMRLVGQRIGLMQ